MKYLSSVILVMALVLAPAAVWAASYPAPYQNGFESPGDVSVDDTYPQIDAMFFVERVPSGTAGVTSASGGWHGVAGPSNFGDNGFIYTRYGGYGDTFPSGGYTTSIDIYLDTSKSLTGVDIRFDWSSAISTPDGNHRRDFIFSVGTDKIGGFVMSASNNAPGWPANPGRDPYTISESGWYTFMHSFYDDGSGVLAVDMSVLDADGSVLHTWTLSDASDVIDSTVGGNRYGWLVTNGFDALPLDNVTRSGAVAQTRAQCKNGGWEYVFRPDGGFFKNQGDCIQFINTGK